MVPSSRVQTASNKFSDVPSTIQYWEPPGAVTFAV
jgi:hypothetical protein